MFGNIDFISRKTPKILILSAKLNILKKDVADESMNINPQIQNNLRRREKGQINEDKYLLWRQRVVRRSNSLCFK